MSAAITATAAVAVSILALATIQRKRESIKPLAPIAISNSKKSNVLVLLNSLNTNFINPNVDIVRNINDINDLNLLKGIYQNVDIMIQKWDSSTASLLRNFKCRYLIPSTDFEITSTRTRKRITPLRVQADEIIILNDKIVNFFSNYKSKISKPPEIFLIDDLLEALYGKGIKNYSMPIIPETLNTFETEYKELVSNTSSSTILKSFQNVPNDDILHVYWNPKRQGVCIVDIKNLGLRRVMTSSPDLIPFIKTELPISKSSVISSNYYLDFEELKELDSKQVLQDIDLNQYVEIVKNYEPLEGEDSNTNLQEKVVNYTEDYYISRYRNSNLILGVKINNIFYIIFQNNGQRFTEEPGLEQEVYRKNPASSDDWVSYSEFENIPDIAITSTKKSVIPTTVATQFVNGIYINKMIQVFQGLKLHLELYRNFVQGKIATLQNEPEFFSKSQQNINDYLVGDGRRSLGQVLKHYGKEHITIMYDFVADVYLCRVGHEIFQDLTDEGFWNSNWFILCISKTLKENQKSVLKPINEAEMLSLASQTNINLWDVLQISKHENSFYIVGYDPQTDVKIRNLIGDTLGFEYIPRPNERRNVYYETFGIDIKNQVHDWQRYYLKDSLVSVFDGRDIYGIVDSNPFSIFKYQGKCLNGTRNISCFEFQHIYKYKDRRSIEIFWIENTLKNKTFIPKKFVYLNGKFALAADYLTTSLELKDYCRDHIVKKLWRGNDDFFRAYDLSIFWFTAQKQEDANDIRNIYITFRGENLTLMGGAVYPGVNAAGNKDYFRKDFLSLNSKMLKF